MRICRLTSLILTLLLAPGLRTQREPPGQSGELPWQAFVIAGGSDQRAAREALDMIGSKWRDGYAPMILDVARLLPLVGAGASRRRRSSAMTAPACHALPRIVRSGSDGTLSIQTRCCIVDSERVL